MGGDCLPSGACQGPAEQHQCLPWELGSSLFPRWKESLAAGCFVIFLRPEESWGFPGSSLLPEWNPLAFPLPKETWGMVDVIGFRVGLAFLLSPESLGSSPLCTPMTAVPLPNGPALVPVTANLSIVLGSCSEAG